jgi:serine/threonine protein kinase
MVVSNETTALLKSPLVKLRSNKVTKYGSGVSGSVVVYKYKSVHYAVKTYFEKENYETTKEYRRRILHEYEVLKRLRHINIIVVYKYSISLLGKIKLYQLAGSRNLYSLMKEAISIDHEELHCVWKQIVNAVTYLHQNEWCHRDIKLQNVVFDPVTGYVKLIDFVTAVNQTTPKSIGLVGSENYCSPEMYSEIYYDGYKSDVWSLGVCLYQLLRRKLPWKYAKHDDERFKQYLAVGEFNEKLNFSENSLLKEMLLPDVEKRPTIEQVNANPWVQSIDSCTEIHRCRYNHVDNFKLSMHMHMH